MGELPQRIYIGSCYLNPNSKNRFLAKMKANYAKARVLNFLLSCRIVLYTSKWQQYSNHRYF
jgi:hypothetical protein